MQARRSCSITGARGTSTGQQCGKPPTFSGMQLRRLPLLALVVASTSCLHPVAAH